MKREVAGADSPPVALILGRRVYAEVIAYLNKLVFRSGRFGRVLRLLNRVKQPMTILLVPWHQLGMVMLALYSEHGEVSQSENVERL